MFARTLLAAGVTVLALGCAAAQPAATPPAPTASDNARPKGIVVTPPAGVDPALAKPAPAVQDPGLVQKPPGQADPAGRDKSREPASRQDDCRGSAEDCKQSSPK